MQCKISSVRVTSLILFGAEIAETREERKRVEMIKEKERKQVECVRLIFGASAWCQRAIQILIIFIMIIFKQQEV